MSRMQRVVTRSLAAFMSLGLLSSLAACQGQVPKVQKPGAAPAGVATSAPNLTTKQEAAIRKDIGQVLDKANESKDPTGLDARVTGPQLQIRTSELEIARATGNLNPKTTIPTTIARLFQGAQLPKFPVDTIGAQMGTPTDEGLKATPAEAVRRYADVLQNPGSSQYAKEFAQDDFRTSMDTLTQAVQKGIEALYIPSSTSQDPIRAVGAEREPIKVEAV